MCVEIGVKSIQYYLNCWEPLKTTKPQRRNEINSIVKVTKVEKICCMA
nr:MAG TPA: Wound-induced protein [Caudoviricetes sp.]